MQEKQIDVRVVLTQSYDVAIMICNAFTVGENDVERIEYGSTGGTRCSEYVPPSYRKDGMYYASICWKREGNTRKPYELIFA